MLWEEGTTGTCPHGLISDVMNEKKKKRRRRLMKKCRVGTALICFVKAKGEKKVKGRAGLELTSI